ncbi:hypothetical protein [Nocardia sp. NPDC020380]|uniref:protein kinase domain-containing protein n=1 Tax=Nocardia sp. NPDC020380 TaxID=3364309 RepID=UPI0037A3549E
MRVELAAASVNPFDLDIAAGFFEGRMPHVYPVILGVGAAATGDDEIGGVLLDGRFEVHRAIRHANKGGVFEGIDRSTGLAVIVKQARAGVGTGRHATDFQSALRNEAALFEALAGQRAAPRSMALFEQGGDLFHVQERIDGVTLAAWRKQHHRLPGWRAMALRLVDLVGAAHGKDIVLCDLSPSNVMVRADESLVLIDLEYATRTGETTAAAWTPGYAAPEHMSGEPAHPALDGYSLGALLFLLCSGGNPTLTADDEAGRSLDSRVTRLLELAAATDSDTAESTPLLRGLLREDSEQRWSLTCARSFLTTRASSALDVAAGPRGVEGDVDRMLADGIDYLISSVRPEDPDRLWKPHTNSEHSVTVPQECFEH